jgi:hypothetical protein
VAAFARNASANIGRTRLHNDPIQSIAKSLTTAFKIQEKDYKLNIIVYSTNQDTERCFNVF